jgi:hypothetical protein
MAGSGIAEAIWALLDEADAEERQAAQRELRARLAAKRRADVLDLNQQAAEIAAAGRVTPMLGTRPEAPACLTPCDAEEGPQCLGCAWAHWQPEEEIDHG